MAAGGSESRRTNGAKEIVQRTRPTLIPTDDRCRCLGRLVLWAVFVTVLNRPAAANPVSSTTGLQQRFSRAHFEFSLSLYSLLSADNPPDSEGEAGNLVFSPHSVSTVLAMIFLGAGAGSDTSLQLRSALHLNNFSFNEVHSSFKTVLANLADPYYAEAVAATNGVFQQQNGFLVSDKYRRALEEFYAAEVHAVDFLSDPFSAMEQINAWASNVTAGKMSRLFRRPLDPSTKLILISGLSFRSPWLYRFDSTMTFDKGLFYTTSKKRYEIPMMVGRFKIPVGYSSDLECRVAELPFASRRVSLFIILPDDVDRGLAKLEQNMSPDNIKALFSTLKDEVVNIRLPRFRLQQDMKLTRALRSLGVVDVFDYRGADLSGISPDRIHLNSIVHKSLLEVSEDGVEAAAATMSGLNRLGAFGEKYFEVDHPFVFFLWDYHSGILLFLGRVTAPEPWIK